MTTLWDYVHSELDEPETMDLVGLGAADREYNNQWLYRMNRNFSRLEGMEEVEDYWLGFEDDPTREYDITGDVFEEDFSDQVLDSDVSVLVAPKPSVYRGAASDEKSHVGNYLRFAETADREIDAVLMREVRKDFENFPKHLEYGEMAQNFREPFQKKQLSMQEMTAADMANILQMEPGIKATQINWQPENFPDEEMVLLQNH